MKWFKHHSTLAMEQISRKIIDKHGFAGYGRYMVILEQIALELNKNSRDATYTMAAKSWSNLLGYRSPKHVIEFINELQETGALEVLKPELNAENGQKVNTNCTQSVTKNAFKAFLNQSEITLSVPKLLNLKDEYTRNSGVTQDTIKDKEEDKDKDKDKEKKIQKEKKETLSSPGGEGSLSENLDSQKPKISVSAFPYLRIGASDLEKEQAKRFERAWAGYPKKAGKKEAWTHYRAWVKTPEDHEKLMLHLANYKAHAKANDWPWQNGSTWFNNWQDEAWMHPPPKGSGSSDKLTLADIEAITGEPIARNNHDDIPF